MKLFIINGENNNEKIEIHINEYLMVENIKYKLQEIFSENENFTKIYFRLIYKNIILSDDNSIKYYKICENDEIWFGKIDKYLRKDDVIVYVFHLGRVTGNENLIVKINDTISTIKSIIEIIHSEIINIWNADGKQMKNDQIVTEIDTNENYKLIIRYDDGEGNRINNTFDQCCYLHDKNLVDQYSCLKKINDNKSESAKTLLINGIHELKHIISTFGTFDEELKQNLSDFPSSFLNLTNFFCFDMTVRIFDICGGYWVFVMDQFENDVVTIFLKNFCPAIRSALWDFSNIRQQNSNKTNKSVSDIIIDALDYLMKYLKDSNKDRRYWDRLWMNRYLLTSFKDFDFHEKIDKCTIKDFTIKMRINGRDINNFIPSKPETIIEAKRTISAVYKVDMKHLYCIQPGGDHKPNDEEQFDDEYIIEIVMSMEDIQILRSLGRGAFGATYLYLDKTSNKQFVLKKAIRNHGDLCRDINIYSKLNSSRNIMNYSGLFIDGEHICIGMEYLSGGSLKSYLDKEKHLSEQEIVRFSYEILTQINEFHELEIIHRDIKSDNIVVDEHNHAKLIDFGLSKYKIGLTSRSLIDKLKAYKPGTICYMAPELIREQPYSEKIDIWSFGMLIVEMVTC